MQAQLSADRVPVAMYRDLEQWMLQNDSDAVEMLRWCMTDRRPGNAEDLAREIIWIILCAGRSAQAARTIEARVIAAVEQGRPALEAFGFRAKAAAIDRAWRDRESDLAACHVALASGSVETVVDWCGSIPWIGDDTKFQLAKNIGCDDVTKPDIWMCRLAGFPDRPRRPVAVRFAACLALARPLAAATGSSVAMVDSILWLACNKGVLQVDACAGPVRFAPHQITARSILAPAVPV
jgi:hypothetical protein